MMKIITMVYWVFWLLVLPLVYWPGSIDFEFPKFMIFLSATQIWGIIYFLKTKTNFLKIENKYDWIILSFLGVMLFSWMLNGFEIESFTGEIYRYQGIMTWAVMIEWYFLSKQFLKIDFDKKIITYGGFFLAIIGGFYPMMGNPNFLAAYLVLLNAVNFQLLTSGTSGIIVWINQSRSAGLALITQILLTIKNKKGWWIALVILVLVAIRFPRKPVSRFDNRLIIWQKSVEVIKQKPVWGWGPERFDQGFESILTDKDFDLKNIRVDRAHNIFLDITANYGIIGLIYWLELFYFLFKKSRRPERIFLIAFLIVSNLNVINLNSWLLFYLIAAKIFL